jgi:outer membrane protein assembly factor BamB
MYSLAHACRHSLQTCLLTLTCGLIAVLPVDLDGEDWPVYQHDNYRSATTSEHLQAGLLEPAWSWESPHPPHPAWSGPAKWDAYAGIRGLRSMRNYDPVFHVVVASGKVFFGSTVDDSVRCLDARTGQVRWIFHTEGPIRIAPTYHDKRLYFGSDDGVVRCLDAEQGQLIWSFRPKPLERLILNNGRLIPFWPVRTGVLVRDGTAYFAASLLPWKASYLCAIDAETGKPAGDGHFVRQIDSASFEGALLASEDQLVAPQGRVSPLIYQRSNGTLIGGLKGGGGCFVMLTPEDGILHGPGNKTGWITDSKRQDRSTYATYKDGNAMVVDGNTAYLLTDTTLAAVDRSRKKALWRHQGAFPYSLAKAGPHLYAGGLDTLAAFDAEDGRPVWQTDLAGRVHGLAIANGALFASTDQGGIHCFRATASQPYAAPSQGGGEVSSENHPLAPLAPVDDKALASRWVFQENLRQGVTMRNLAGGNTAKLTGAATLERVADRQVLLLDGSTSAVVKGDLSIPELPVEAFTAEAWVRVDEAHAWGGIIGVIQDNGAYEKGWLLGFVDQRFSFALNGQGGDDRLNYMTAEQAFVPRQWYHLAATYDGARMQLHVNGERAASSDAQSGAIQYPPHGFYEMGAYHDENEHHFTKGMLHETRVYHRVLSESEIKRHALEAKFPLPEPPAPELELASGPTLEFISRSEAEIWWETRHPSPTRLTLEGPGEEPREYRDARRKTEHRIIVQGLQHNRVYHFELEVIGPDGKPGKTRAFECDTLFNFAMSPVSPMETLEDQGTTRSAAADILTTSGITRGICLLVGDSDAALAHALAEQSHLRVIGLEEDPKQLHSSRQWLTDAGSYGARVALHRFDPADPLPLNGMFANLMVLGAPSLQEELPGAWRAMMHCLRPDGGVAYLAYPEGMDKETVTGTSWYKALRDLATEQELDLAMGKGSLTLTRGPLPGAGEWSHQYGNASNAAFGGETLSGVSSTSDLEVQWIGRPGPRAQPDRNGRKPAPLSTGGKLFVQGLNRIITLDAYNGTVLWSRELPQIQRFNMPRDSSNWAANRRYLFAAIEGECWKWDAHTGKLEGRMAIPEQAVFSDALDWSYLSPHRDRIIGSSVVADSAFTSFWGGGGAGWYDAKSGEVTQKVCSENLFAVDTKDGSLAWQYKGGLIVNSTITLADDRAWFVEARHPELRTGKERQLGGDLFWEQQYLVCLHLETGTPLWSEPLRIVPGEVALYLARGGGKLVMVSSGSAAYNTYAFKDDDGTMVWNRKIPWPQDHHGGHMARPAIVGDTVYVRPSALSLATGASLDIQMPGGGCGTYAASKNALFFRSGNVTMWDRKAGETTSWSRLRPDCWLSTIPAAGLLLSPEGGGGCSCGSWMETSIVFAPKRRP